jgi:flagellar biosynthesis protein FliR
MAIFNFQTQQVYILMFIFLRIASILLFLPLFDNRSIPILFKIGLSFVFSLSLMPLLDFRGFPNTLYDISVIVGIFSEIFLGVSIGLAIKLIFSGIQLGAEIVGYQMGLAMANLFDAASGSQASVISNLKFMLAMLVFLSIDAHHFFFKIISESFITIPLFGFGISASLTEYLTLLGSKMFVIAVKLSAPLFIAMLFSNVALGLIARMVPQMNIFFVAMPVNLFVGLVLLGLMLPAYSFFLVPIFNEFGNILLTLLKIGAF